MVLKRLNTKGIQAVFADIDGTTRENGKFGKKIPIITLTARLIHNIPIIPVTGRDLNGWLSIKNSRHVFGNRKTSLSIQTIRRSDPYKRRRFLRPENPREIKKYLEDYGGVIVNNGGTITSLDGRIIFQHYPFTEAEKQILTKLISKYKESITHIEIANSPGNHTTVILPYADDGKVEAVKKLHGGKVDVFTLWETARYSFETTPDEITKLLSRTRTPKISISTKYELDNNELLHELDKANLEVTSNEGSLAISAQNKNKRTGIDWIAEHLRLDLSKCIFIGNDHNDTPALTHPDLGYPIFIGDPKVVSSRRLKEKYGTLPKNTIFVDNFNELSNAISPLFY